MSICVNICKYMYKKPPRAHFEPKFKCILYLCQLKFVGFGDNLLFSCYDKTFYKKLSKHCSVYPEHTVVKDERY